MFEPVALERKQQRQNCQSALHDDDESARDPSVLSGVLAGGKMHQRRAKANQQDQRGCPGHAILAHLKKVKKGMICTSASILHPY